MQLRAAAAALVNRHSGSGEALNGKDQKEDAGQNSLKVSLLIHGDYCGVVGIVSSLWPISRSDLVDGSCGQINKIAVAS